MNLSVTMGNALNLTILTTLKTKKHRNLESW